ncbi:MAG: PEP-CTERM sorting domain-containing protein [Acidobacteria bacterium]|nr:PEP-CTERM sorting domain-containing protein [Acidobacteriota bacterium]
MMSLKRVVLIAALVALVSPAAALADGITFGFQAGNLLVPRPFLMGSTGATTGTVTLSYLTKFTGSVPFGPPVGPTYGTPPVVVPPGTPANPFDFGTLSFTTGSVIGIGPTSATFGAGGLITITSNAGLTAATSGAIGNPVTLFSGWFSGPTTMTQINAPNVWCLANPTCAANFNYKYTLTGPVSGNLDAAILSHFGLGSNPTANGLLITLMFGFVGPTDPLGNVEGGATSVVVPEPGTLALFATGLIGVAGFIRRRIKS